MSNNNKKNYIHKWEVVSYRRSEDEFLIFLLSEFTQAQSGSGLTKHCHLSQGQNNSHPRLHYLQLNYILLKCLEMWGKAMRGRTECAVWEEWGRGSATGFQEETGRRWRMRRGGCCEGKNDNAVEPEGKDKWYEEKEEECGIMKGRWGNVRLSSILFPPQTA